MILLTVGTQLPFDRLVDAIDEYGRKSGEEVVAQTGDAPDARRWPHLDVRTWIAPSEFDDLLARCRVIVSHAGIGTILSAREAGRPLVVLPRRHDLGEHRNDHQMATARELAGSSGVYVAWEVGDIPALLGKDLAPPENDQSPRLKSLIDGLRGFI